MIKIRINKANTQNVPKKKKSRKRWMMIALDFNSKKSRTSKRDPVLDEYGFSRKTPKRKIPLPESTYIGKVSSWKKAQETIKIIWDDLKCRNIAPTRICGGFIEEWKVIRSTDDKD